jgi:GTP-binding protein EngB required for normal cell division
MLDRLSHKQKVSEDTVAKLLMFFLDKARPALESRVPETLGPLDNDYARLVRLLNRPKAITICFLGHSGVGKSTLLNALAGGSRQVLPAGGIGPLTAMATEVRYSDHGFFNVTYHPRHHVTRLLFALEQKLKRLGSEASPQDVKSSGQNELELDADARADVTEEVNSADEISADSGRDPVEQYIKQAKQIICGDQFSQVSLEYLIDALRVACDLNPVWNSDVRGDDLRRVSKVRDVLRLAREIHTYKKTLADGDQQFIAELNDHTAGFLAPLIATIRVGWPSELLHAGVILVDLPGVGIAQDSYRQLTKEYVRDRARAVVLVVDRAGPTQDSVELLRTSGYWDRLVGSMDDPESDPSNMIIVVTKVDDVAAECWRNLAQTNRPRKREVYAELVTQFQVKMRAQIRDQLMKFGSSTNEIVSEARAKARDQILDNLEIHPVSAPEYRKLIVRDEDDAPFLSSEIDTGIPNLAQSLRTLALAEASSRERQIDEVFQRFVSGIISAIRLAKSPLEDQTGATRETKRVAAALDKFTAPKRRERDLRVGAFREFLEATAQSRIRELVLEAKEVAQEEIHDYLKTLQTAHWSTLRAAVRRGGAFIGSRAINLPVDIADRFQEPMAAVWSQRLLKDIRKRTAELAADISNIVEEICGWAEVEMKADLNAELLNDQKKRIADRVAVMKQVGKEAVDELRQVVKQKLSDVIQKPIRQACQKFVTEGDDQGTGVKQRILVLFNSLAKQSTAAAQPPAISVLKQNFEKVRVEINESFNSWGDPIQETVDIIMRRHNEKVALLTTGDREAALIELDTLLESAHEFS